MCAWLKLVSDTADRRSIDYQNLMHISPQIKATTDMDRQRSVSMQMRYLCYTALSSALMLSVLAWTHTVMDMRYGEEEPDWSFYGFIVGGWICKTVVLLSMPLLLASLYEVSANCSRLWRRWFAAWSTGMVVLIAILALTRDHLANCFNSETFRMFPVSGDISAAHFHFVGREDWLERWQDGEIVLIELAYVFTLGAIVRIGALASSKPIVATLLASTGCLATIIVWPTAFGLVSFDYDTFFGGILSDSIFVDTIIVALRAPFAPVDMTTQIASLAYLVITASVACVVVPQRATYSPAA